MQETINEEITDIVPHKCIAIEACCSEENTKDGISYGKFKSADTLYQAYCELEKEFTKKCQKINEFSKINKIDIESRVKDCIDVNPKLADYADKIAEIYAEGGAAEVKLAKLLNGVVNAPVEIIKDANFLNEYVYGNAEINKHIINAYLEEIAQNKLPKCVTAKGKTLLTPISRPKNLSEAGRIAQNILDNRRL